MAGSLICQEGCLESDSLAEGVGVFTGVYPVFAGEWLY